MTVSLCCKGEIVTALWINYTSIKLKKKKRKKKELVSLLMFAPAFLGFLLLIRDLLSFSLPDAWRPGWIPSLPQDRH